MIGIRTMIADEAVGRLLPNGKVEKKPTPRDEARLRRGMAVAKDIMLQTGIRTNIFVKSKVQGCHSGGTCAVGRVVDADLQTEVDGLFVCDGSVLPEAPGLPPLVTIMALAKRLAKTVSGRA